MNESVFRGHSHTIIETDNIQAINILNNNKEEILEAESLTEAAQQISVLHSELNKVFEDGSQPRTCRISTIFSTRNRAPMFLAEYGFNHYESLVDVPYRFGRFAEVLDLENGLGPHLPAFEVHPNFGFGEVLNPAFLTTPATHNMMQISESLFDTLFSMAFGLQNNMHGFNDNIHFGVDNQEGNLALEQALLVVSQAAIVVSRGSASAGIVIRDAPLPPSLPPSLDVAEVKGKGKGKMSNDLNGEFEVKGSGISDVQDIFLVWQLSQDVNSDMTSSFEVGSSSRRVIALDDVVV
ncbi:hypothetical protein AgCh_012496 [Apium graveolens]